MNTIRSSSFCVACGVVEGLHDRPYGDCGTAARKAELLEAFAGRRPLATEFGGTQ
jgi:hypothetical protein